MTRHLKGSSPKLTSELIKDISLLLRRGSYIESAAAACGISKDTFYRWLRNAKSEEATELEAELSDAVLKSMAESELRDLEIIDKAAMGTPDVLEKDEHGNLVLDSEGRPIVLEYGTLSNWKASAWRLERKFPDRWGNKRQIELQREGSSIEIVFVDS